VTAETLRRWAENLCHVKSTARSELVDAIEGTDETTLPPGVTWIELDERDIGLGGIWLRFAPRAINRRQFEKVFGRGEDLVRVPADAPAKYMTTVEAPRAPHRCTVIAEYRSDLEDVDLQGVYLRIDRPR
jgi:hypothetical protein